MTLLGGADGAESVCEPGSKGGSLGFRVIATDGPRGPGDTGTLSPGTCNNPERGGELVAEAGEVRTSGDRRGS